MSPETPDNVWLYYLVFFLIPIGIVFLGCLFARARKGISKSKGRNNDSMNEDDSFGSGDSGSSNDPSDFGGGDFGGGGASGDFGGDD